MIDRALKWLADRPFSRHRWVEDIYARAELRRWDRMQRRRARAPSEARALFHTVPRKGEHPKA